MPNGGTIYVVRRRFYLSAWLFGREFDILSKQIDQVGPCATRDGKSFPYSAERNKRGRKAQKEPQITFGE